MLDVASAREPDWSEQRTDLKDVKYASPRQLGGIYVIVAATTVMRWRWENERVKSRSQLQMRRSSVVLEAIGANERLVFHR